MDILQQVKEKLKNFVMKKRYLIGPIITAIVLYLHSLAVQTGLIPYSAAGLYLVFLFVGFTSGLWAAVLSAVFLAFYSLAYLGPITQERIVVSLSYLIAAGLMGWQTRRQSQEHARADSNQDARQIVDTLNGNIIRIIEAREMVEQVLALDFLTEGTRSKLGLVLHTLRNLQQATQGWQQLAEIRKEHGDKNK